MLSDSGSMNGNISITVDKQFLEGLHTIACDIVEGKVPYNDDQIEYLKSVIQYMSENADIIRYNLGVILRLK